jgi:hypothetical protein
MIRAEMQLGLAGKVILSPSHFIDETFSMLGQNFFVFIGGI